MHGNEKGSAILLLFFYLLSFVPALTVLLTLDEQPNIYVEDALLGKWMAL